MKIVGIDPGNSGAIAIWNGKELRVVAMPVVSIKTGKSVKNRVDAALLASYLRQETDIEHVFVELVNAMPGQGVTSMFTFGRGAGIIEGVLAGLELPYTLVSPVKWRNGIGGMSKGKDAARARAAALFPKFADLFKRKCDNGRADAALIAKYGRRELLKEQ